MSGNGIDAGSLLGIATKKGTKQLDVLATGAVTDGASVQLASG